MVLSLLLATLSAFLMMQYGDTKIEVTRLLVGYFIACSAYSLGVQAVKDQMLQLIGTPQQMQEQMLAAGGGKVSLKQNFMPIIAYLQGL